MSPCPQRRNAAGPSLKRYVQSIPGGRERVLFLDSGWMDETVQERLRGSLSERGMPGGWKAARMMERQLAAAAICCKLFPHIDRERQKRLKKLASKGHGLEGWGKLTAAEQELWADTGCLQDFMSATDAPWARWKVIDGSHAVQAQLEAADWLYHQICTALDCRPATEQPKREWPLLPMEPLSQVRLDQALGGRRSTGSS